MKIIKAITICFLILTLSFCGAKGNSKQDQSEQVFGVPSQADSIELHTSIKAVSYRFQCLINDKYPVDLTFEIYKDIIQGYIVYTNNKSKTPIYLLGEVISYDNEMYEFSICEMSFDGSVTGFIKGHVTEKNGLEGTWSAPDKYVEKDHGYSFDYIQGKSYSLRTIKIADKSTHLYSDVTLDWKINIDDACGSYFYSLGKNCASGKIEIFPKGNKTMCNIYSNTSAPSFNMAFVEEQECVVEDDRFVCTLATEEPCKFAIYPFEKFVVVEYIGENRHCGFGMNATIEGIYLKYPDTDNITSKGSVCALFADEDKENPTNIRNAPNGGIVCRVSPEDRNFLYFELVEYKNGWFKIEGDLNSAIPDEGVETIKLKGDCWIHHYVVGATLMNILCKVRNKPNLSADVVAEFENPYVGVNFLDLHGDWFKVKLSPEGDKKTYVGWIPSNWICCNPLTTCP